MLKDGEAANESKEIIGKTANILKKPILSLKNFFLDKIAPKIGYVKKGGTRFKGEEGLRDLIKQAGHEGEADDLIKLLKNYNDNPKDMELKFMVKDKFMPIFKDFFGINKEGKISEIMKKSVILF